MIEAKSAYDPYHPKAEAQTPHGDHAIVSYQVPAQARALPLVFLHGASQISAAPDEGFFFEQFRMGLWAQFNAGSVFPQDPKSLDQFFRQMTPNTAPYDVKVNADALTSVFEKTGDAVFVTHSQGCGIGWLIGMQSDHVKGIVAYEPGSGFPFPKGEVPTPIENAGFSET